MKKTIFLILFSYIFTVTHAQEQFFLPDNTSQIKRQLGFAERQSKTVRLSQTFLSSLPDEGIYHFQLFDDVNVTK